MSYLGNSVRAVASEHPIDSSVGSAIDSDTIAWGDGEHGVLLLHGLTGTPYEVRPFAQALHERGFAVRAPRLPGHEDVDTLERATWRDWYACVEQSFAELHDGGRRRVLVLGFSLGSLLALRLAALRPRELAGLVAVSVPLSLPTWQRHGIHVLAGLRAQRWLGGLVGVLAKQPDVRVGREHRESPSLKALPFPALAQLCALQDEVAGLLPLVRAPLLLLHGALDHVAPPKGSARIAQRVASSIVRRIVLPSSFHLVGLDLDRDRACTEVVDFTLSQLGEPRPAPTSIPEPR